jgi:hypothetical protein
VFLVETQEDCYYIYDGGHNELSCVAVGKILMNHHDGDLKSTETWEKRDRILEKSAGWLAGWLAGAGKTTKSKTQSRKNPLKN